jgi:hypothetical protein
MEPPHGEDLGHGVHASPGTGGELTVTSRRLHLLWRPAEGRVPGTAVLWRDSAFEVVARSEKGSGICWTLRRWDEATAMRGVFTLDRDSIQDVAEKVEAEAHNRRSRGWSLILLPVLGLAPNSLQKKWENEWGYAAARATFVSAIFEMLAGTAGTVQMAAAAFGGAFFMPPALAIPGPILFLSGAARLAMVFGDGEPVGSPLGLPFLLLVPRSARDSQPISPPARSSDGEDLRPSFLRTMLVSAAVTLGPASDQLRWAQELGVHAIWLTIAGAGAELVGGIANLRSDLGAAPLWLVVLDLFLTGEGLLRLGSASVGRPMGSVFGWALRPLYSKYLPPAQ